MTEKEHKCCDDNHWYDLLRMMDEIREKYNLDRYFQPIDKDDKTWVSKIGSD